MKTLTYNHVMNGRDKSRLVRGFLEGRFLLAAFGMALGSAAPALGSEGSTLQVSTTPVVVSTPSAVIVSTPVVVTPVAPPAPILPVAPSVPVVSVASAAVVTGPVPGPTPAPTPLPVALPPAPIPPLRPVPPPLPPVPVTPPALLLMLHPAEGMKVPPINQIFVYGAVSIGSTLSINGSTVTVHSHGGYLTMWPVTTGENVLHTEVRDPAGRTATMDRHFTVSPGFQISASTPAVIERYSVTPQEDQTMTAGDVVRVSFQGSPGGSAEFSILGSTSHIMMSEVGFSTSSRRGVYTGFYVIPATARASHAVIDVTLKKAHRTVTARAIGRLTIDPGAVPIVGMIMDDTVAVRTAPDGGYDMFVYRGMRVRLTGKSGNQWRVRFSSTQSGWVKESAVLQLPLGVSVPQSVLSNITITHPDEDTLIRIPLSDSLPYKVEQSLDPMQLAITFYGAYDKTELIRYDPADPLIKIVRWKQLAPDTVQVIIQPKFKTWWGFETHYDGNTLVVEVRSPWTGNGLTNMVIAVDPGHGGSDDGATGPHGLREKESNLQIARVVRDELAKAGAKPFLTRDADVDVSLYDRPRIAWAHRARLFVSVHANAPGEGENPVWNNGFSTYWYQPQSLDLATAVHEGYMKRVQLPDHGLFFADLAVCRMTQMPAILTEQAFIVVPDQEDMLFDTRTQKDFAAAIVAGIKAFLAKGS